MHIFLNGLGASAGGGLTYIKNVLPHFSRADVRTTVAISANFDAGPHENIEYVHVPAATRVARRMWFEQRELPKLIRNCGADLLISAGNFALRRSPVPQILLSRNSLYTSREFSRDLITRPEYRMWLDTKIKAALAKKSTHWADCTVAPSEAFAKDLRTWTRQPAVSIHHGFDPEVFTANQQPLPEKLRTKLKAPPGALRILLVSHYNYYRNFETVFRGIANLAGQWGFPSVRLFLTCELKKETTPGAYNPASAATLIQRLGIREQVVEIGAVPYEQLHHVYRACDIFVTAAYTETFAHPLVEAMSCGLPVVASDLAVHREICRDAALYFPPFSPDDLAAQVAQLASSENLRRTLAASGRDRLRAFSWRAHVEHLLAIGEQLLARAGIVPRAQSLSAA